MQALIKTIWTIFDPVITFWNNIWSVIVFPFQFLWDIITWLYYWFATLVSYFTKGVYDILGYSWFISDNVDFINSMWLMLWSHTAVLFFGLFLCCIIYCIIRFVFKLIFIFKH